jgi:signal transduction histidine kinase
VAVERDRRTGVYGGLAGIAGPLAVVGIQNSPDGCPARCSQQAWPAPVAAGDPLRSARRNRGRGRARTEPGNVKEARRRAAEERLHIARELHDVVAHRMAVVNVQAGVAEHLLRSWPDDAAASPRRAIGAGGARQHGSILNVLRTARESDASVEPAPMLTELTALIDSYQNAGLTIEHETSGAARPLADTTQLALYRTVQEALTNAHKYGDGHVRLRISHAANGVAVDVINPVGDVTSRPDAVGETGGFGLMGMRERVLAVGGTLRVGPDGESRFAVHARFPAGEQ